MVVPQVAGRSTGGACSGFDRASSLPPHSTVFPHARGDREGVSTSDPAPRTPNRPMRARCGVASATRSAPPTSQAAGRRTRAARTRSPLRSAGRTTTGSRTRARRRLRTRRGSRKREPTRPRRTTADETEGRESSSPPAFWCFRRRSRTSFPAAVPSAHRITGQAVTPQVAFTACHFHPPVPRSCRPRSSNPSSRLRRTRRPT